MPVEDLGLSIWNKNDLPLNPFAFSKENNTFTKHMGGTIAFVLIFIINLVYWHRDRRVPIGCLSSARLKSQYFESSSNKRQ